jgi:fatty-acyl-CoA synthase
VFSLSAAVRKGGIVAAKKKLQSSQTRKARLPETKQRASTRKSAGKRTSKPVKRDKWAALEPSAVNRVALSPIPFLPRAAEIYPDRVAVVHGDRAISYREFLERANRLGSALKRRGVRKGDVVAVMLPNVPAMLDAHFGVPMIGAVLNTINTRLDAETIAYILEHGEAKVLITDREFAGVVGPALAKAKRKIIVIDNDDPFYTGPGERVGSIEYEAFLNEGSPDLAWSLPDDEYAPIALNYTSGTTGRPKGVVYHHRGAFLESASAIMGWPLPAAPIYLWTLPLFHCNGWCYSWAVTAMAGTHVCLRRVDPVMVFDLIAKHGVTHMCGAPTVLSMLINLPAGQRRAFTHQVALQTGGSPPPAKVLKAMEDLGFHVLHIYGMTELHGASTTCAPQEEWRSLADEERALHMARQGVRMPAVHGQIVGDPRTCKPVRQDGEAVGEILIRGNTVMLGYLKDPKATAQAFAGGWMHSGDLAVWHPDNYVEIKDRKKDIIISGGENISSVEIETALYRHPAIALAAAVAQPDAKWGEVPCVFVQLKPDAHATEADIIEHCRGTLARFKLPKRVVIGAVPVTATGKIQKYVLREQARASASTA